MNRFRQLRDLGYRNVLPIIPPDAEIYPNSRLYKLIGTKNDGRGKTPGVKRGDEWSGLGEWQTVVATDAQLDAWHEMGAGVGLRCADGIIAVDIDATDKPTADAIEADALERFGPSPQRVGRWPKRALLYRITEDIDYQFVVFDGASGPEKIEVAARGRQIVMSGVHPKTQEPYKWPRKLVPFDQLSEVTPDQVAAFLAHWKAILPGADIQVQNSGAERAEDQATLRAKDQEMFKRAVRALPNNRDIYPSRDDYIRVGAAIKAALDDKEEAFNLWCEWAEKDEGGEPDLWRKDWEGLGDKQSLGADWLYKQVEKHVPSDVFDVAEMWLEDLTGAAGDTASDQPKSKKYDFENFADVVSGELTYAPHLIDGLLDQGAMSVVYGDSNVGKTFVVMDMAFHIAAGLPYAGMDVAPGLVVYVAAEGGHGARKRLKALHEKFPDHNPDFVLLASSVDLRNPKADTVPLAEAIRELGRPVALLVIDTLSRALAGGDENSPVDMGILVKHFDVLRKATKPSHLMVVHHTGKDLAKGARGHTSLRAATDTEIEIAKPKKGETGPSTITVTKQRDMDGEWAAPFKLNVHTLGLKPNGTPVTSCTVELIGAAEARALSVVPTEKEKIVLGLLDSLSEGGEGAWSVEEIASELSDDVSKPALEAMRKHLNRMLAKGLVEKSGRGKWAKKADKSALSVSVDKTEYKHASDRNGQEADSGIFD